MSLDTNIANHNYAPAYQTSAFPFATSSVAGEVTTATPIRVKFPFITRWVVVKNTGTNALKIGFTRNGTLGPLGLADEPYVLTGSNANFFVVGTSGSESTTPRLEVKCSEMWFLADDNTTGFSLLAGYTTIPETQFMVLTGTNEFQGVG